MPIPIIDSVLSIGERLIDKLIPDPKAKADALQKLREMEQAGDLAVIANQVEINKIEASNPNWFISGWRPAVGWVCVLALAVQMVFAPLAVWVALLLGHTLPMVAMDVSLLTTLLVGMLGLGGMRTIERLSGVANGQK